MTSGGVAKGPSSGAVQNHRAWKEQRDPPRKSGPAARQPEESSACDAEVMPQGRPALLRAWQRQNGGSTRRRGGMAANSLPPAPTIIAREPHAKERNDAKQKPACTGSHPRASPIAHLNEAFLFCPHLHVFVIHICLSRCPPAPPPQPSQRAPLRRRRSPCSRRLPLWSWRW